MSKCAKISTASGKFHGWYVFCPACRTAHLFDSRWSFNGDVDKPTFKGSMLVHADTEPDGQKTPRCHSFVEDGKIRYLSDCTHDYAGRTVDLPELD